MGASYKSDIKRNGGGKISAGTAGGGGGGVSSNNPRPLLLQSGQSPRPERRWDCCPGAPLSKSASVGDWRRKYLFLEDPEARLDNGRQQRGGGGGGGGEGDRFVEQQPVVGRTFDPVAQRDGQEDGQLGRARVAQFSSLKYSATLLDIQYHFRPRGLF